MGGPVSRRSSVRDRGTPPHQVPPTARPGSVSGNIVPTCDTGLVVLLGPAPLLGASLTGDGERGGRVDVGAHGVLRLVPASALL